MRVELVFKMSRSPSLRDGGIKTFPLYRGEGSTVEWLRRSLHSTLTMDCLLPFFDCLKKKSRSLDLCFLI